jgi:hypothetical protein
MAMEGQVHIDSDPAKRFERKSLTKIIQGFS